MILTAFEVSVLDKLSSAPVEVFGIVRKYVNAETTPNEVKKYLSQMADKNLVAFSGHKDSKIKRTVFGKDSLEHTRKFRDKRRRK